MFVSTLDLKNITNDHAFGNGLIFPLPLYPRVRLLGHLAGGASIWIQHGCPDTLTPKVALTLGQATFQVTRRIPLNPVPSSTKKMNACFWIVSVRLCTMRAVLIPHWSVTTGWYIGTSSVGTLRKIYPRRGQCTNAAKLKSIAKCPNTRPSQRSSIIWTNIS